MDYSSTNGQLLMTVHQKAHKKFESVKPPPLSLDMYLFLQEKAEAIKISRNLSPMAARLLMGGGASAAPHWLALRLSSSRKLSEFQKNHMGLPDRLSPGPPSISISRDQESDILGMIVNFAARSSADVLAT